MAATQSFTRGVRRVWRGGGRGGGPGPPTPAGRAPLDAGADGLGRPETEHWRSIPRGSPSSIMPAALSAAVVAMVITAVLLPPARGLAMVLTAGALVLLA